MSNMLKLLINSPSFDINQEFTPTPLPPKPSNDPKNQNEVTKAFSSDYMSKKKRSKKETENAPPSPPTAALAHPKGASKPVTIYVDRRTLQAPKPDQDQNCPSKWQKPLKRIEKV